MKKILIADCGSTKTDWCLLSEDGKTMRLKTTGFNPVYLSEQEIVDLLQRELVPQLQGTADRQGASSAISIEDVYFYGAGCTKEKSPVVAKALRAVLHVKDNCEVASDMLGAARGVLGHAPGIACILGTGSNSCSYDGTKMLENVSPLGMILGDEGSGAVLGRTLIGDIFKRQLPSSVIEKFHGEYPISLSEIIDKVYHQPMPNRFLASFTPFLSRHLDEESIYVLVVRSFRAFLRRNVRLYDGSDWLPVGFVGSIAWHFREPLQTAIEAEGMHLGRIIQAPMDGLVDYHLHAQKQVVADRPGDRSSAVLPQQDKETTLTDMDASLTDKDASLTDKESSLPITEQPSHYDHLETRSVIDLLRDMNIEDQKVAPTIEKVLPTVAQLVEQIVPRMRKGGRIFYLGAGTSGRLGVLDASELPPTFGVPPTFVIGLIAGGDTALRNAVEKAEDDSDAGWQELLAHGVNQEDTVIGIAASGTTPYVVGAVEKAHDHGILTGCITSNPHTPLAAAADVAIEMIVGPEFITGSSRMKSGTGQKMILNMISTAVMIRLGRVKGNRMVNMQLTNQKLIDRGTRMLVEALHIDYSKARRLLLLHGSVEKALEEHSL